MDDQKFKKYLVKGFVVNQKQLLETKNKFQELQQAVLFLQKQSKKQLLKGQETEILSLLADYSKTLSLLEKYDKGELIKQKGLKTKFIFHYNDCQKIIVELKKNLLDKKEASDLFGQEKGGNLEGIIKGLYQTFGGKDIERALSAVIISQYRRKVAEKYKIALKPVVIFKANRVSIPKEGLSKEHNPQIVVSSIFKNSFHKFISELGEKHLKQQTAIKDAILQKAFQFFNEQKITLADLVAEIKSDFAPEKCLTVDEDKDLEQKQILLNSLEDQNNEIRAIFATEKLNEWWDVLNLFDIVRLYNSRDAKSNKPGKTTAQEAQLIGRGARYYPFTLGEFTDAYRRKFDTDTQNELRILEQLYYHSATNPRYIQELESVLVREDIMPSRTVQKEIKIKSNFKNSAFWKKGYIFLNSRKENYGEAFAPNFVLFLKERKNKKEIVYQIFVEPKNEILAKAKPWKEEFLLVIKKEHKTEFDLIKFKNKDFHLVGLPFFNKGQTNSALCEKFKEAFAKQLLN